MGQAFSGNGVLFDGFNAETRTLLEANGSGYANFLDASGKWWSESAQNGLWEQAKRQITAADGLPIQWHVAEESAANAIRALVGKFGINVIFTPPI